jgi:hypothetical protein
MIFIGSSSEMNEPYPEYDPAAIAFLAPFWGGGFSACRDCFMIAGLGWIPVLMLY